MTIYDPKVYKYQLITFKVTQLEVLSGLVGKQVWHLRGCHLCVGSTPTGANAEGLS